MPESHGVSATLTSWGRADVGIRPFGYLTAMVVTIGLWLTLAPAIGAIARTGKRGKKN